MRRRKKVAKSRPDDRRPRSGRGRRRTARAEARTRHEETAAGNRADGGTPEAADPNAAMRALAQRIIDVTLADDDEAILALYADDIESSEAGQPPQVGLDALRGEVRRLARHDHRQRASSRAASSSTAT